MNFTLLDPVLTQNYCGTSGVTNCPGLSTQDFFGPALIGPQAPAGTNLPVTPKFKGNATARYTFDEMAGWKPFGQVSTVYQTKTAPLLRVDQVDILGFQPAYGLVDLSAGAQHEQLSVQLVLTNATDRRAQLTRFAEIQPGHDNQSYIIPTQPRTISIKFGQRF